MLSLVHLSSELVIAIAEYCSSAEISRLCQTNKYLYTTCARVLYHTLDLSIHNTSIQCKPWRHNSKSGVPVLPEFVEREFTDLDREVFGRQKQFLGAISEGKKNGREYHKYVKKVIWTILDPTEGVSWGISRRILEGGGRDLGAPGDVYMPEDESLWKAFRSFTNATSVEICWLRDWREVTNPGPLFPSATSVRLSGCMTLDFVACILHPPYNRFRHIDLSNLHKWSDTSPELPRFPYLHQLSIYLQDNEDFIEQLHGTRHPIGLLDPLIGKCTSLRSLYISTVGKSDEFAEDPLDERRYASWAQFMSSVRLGIEFLSFSQGVNINEAHAPKDSLLRGPQRSEHRPMDRLFLDHILPILVAAPWPKMKRMEIRGVGRNRHPMPFQRLPTKEEWAQPDVVFSVKEKNFDVGPNGFKYEVTKTVIAFPNAAKHVLRELIPDSAELIIEEKQLQDYERLQEENLGIPYIDYLVDSD